MVYVFKYTYGKTDQQNRLIKTKSKYIYFGVALKF